MRLRTSVLIFGFLAACVHTTREGRPEVVHYQDKLMDQAAFQMGCPRERLTVTQINDKWTAGVEGCEKRLLYKMVVGAGWVANSITDQSGK